MSNTNLFLILGNQLFPNKKLANFIDDDFLMIESFELCTYYTHHKLKIKLFLQAMRNYRDLLLENNFKLAYNDLNPEQKNKNFTQILKTYIKKTHTKIRVFEIEDKFLEKNLTDFCTKNNLELEIIQSPMFVTPRSDFKDYLGSSKKPFMKSFYEKQRKKFKVLLDKDGGPIGGKWSYDAENRKKMPKKYEVPEFNFNQFESKYSDEVNVLIETYFSDHPGELSGFEWPTTRKQYLKLLKNFLDHNLQDFGKYQDAINTKTPFLLHSLLAPGINMGLILPSEVIKKTIEHYYKNTETIPLNSVEGFIRQILGWREFVRGIYQNFSERQDSENYWNHKNELSEAWYNGTTGIPPVDDAIKKALKFGYCHHIERLMILSNIMLLCEIKPQSVHKWFMEMFVDSSDWVMGPNVYGMGQFSDGGIFATKPYISGSNYIMKMSDYKKGEWNDIFDGLYWGFVDKNIEFFNKNPRMKMMVSHLSRMDDDRKKHIFSEAKSFIKRVTV